ncbi:VQ domain-containing protein [Dioscorea alata]|uniref:VQ domain-containing protein n=1 Tax=Dioscorea alata TaxID=55571 RepID=A0ACB7VAS1_DIOAL|nr:VQ domain-containing protein [Dioscorea alata]
MVEKSQAQGTTFVHADACNFMEVVQRLTGPNIKQHPPPPPPPPPPPTSPKITGIRKPTFKLHDRRQGLRSLSSSTSSSSFSLMILKPDTLLHALCSRVLSPPFKSLVSPSKSLSQLDFCEKESSPSSSSCLNEAEEEKAIRERRFYLHPSPRSLSSRVSDPELLSLFPLATPKSQEH